MAKKILKKTSKQLSDIIIKGIQEKKGNDIVSINLKKISGSVSDYFVVCHGSSNTHVQSIARSVDETVKKTIGLDPVHTEGLQNAEWVLLDYFDVVVHVFIKDSRDFFQLEKLWADAEIKNITSEN